MSNLEVAESVLAIPLQYNSQQTNPSKYQKRQVNYLYPTQNTPLDSASNSSMIYRFLVPSDMFLDSKDSYISCEAYIYGASSIPDADKVYFSSYTDTWIQRITLLTSTGIKIEEIIDANVLAAIMKREIEPALLNSVGRQSLACWDIGEVGSANNMNYTVNEKKYYSTLQQVDGKQYPNRFVIPIKMSGFLQSFNYLPLKAMSQGQSNAFQIEIQFAPKESVITAYGTNPGTAPSQAYNYRIQSCYYVMNLIKDDEKEMEIMEIIKTTPLILSYQTHNHYGTVITNPDSVSQFTINVTEYQESVSEVKFTFTNSQRINNSTVDFGTFNNPNLLQVQLQVGNMYIPSQPTPCGKSVFTGASDLYIPQLAEQYLNNAICSQKWGKEVKGFQPVQVISVGGGGTAPFVSTADYKDLVIYFNLRVFQDDATGDALYNQYTSGLNTRTNPVPLQFIFTGLLGSVNIGNGVFEAGVGGDTISAFNVDAFTTYRSNLVIQRGENYVIS